MTQPTVWGRGSRARRAEPRRWRRRSSRKCAPTPREGLTWSLVLKVINLEEGFPSVEQARQKMLRELEAARRSGNPGVKLIHGYGSSGAGGEIRLSAGRALQEMK